MKPLFLALSCSLLFNLAEAQQSASTGYPPQDLQPAQLNQAQEYQLHSQFTHKDYRIQVSRIGEAGEQGYSVLYILDGDYLFPVAHMGAQAMNMRAQDNNAVPFLLVGIGYLGGKLLDPAQRSQDYTPPSADYHHSGDQQNKQFGGADNFLKFIQQELAPDLDQRFRINRQQQNLFGHSYGALFGLYALFNQPESFQNYLLASPSIWWNQQRILQDLPTFLQTPTHKNKIGIAFTVGEYEQRLAPFMPADPKRQKMLNERAMQTNLQQLNQQLQQRTDLETQLRIYPAESHSSSVMPALLDGLKWLFARCQADPQCEK